MYASEGTITACCDNPQDKPLLLSGKCECQARRKQARKQSVRSENSRESSSTETGYEASTLNDTEWALFEQIQRVLFEETFRRSKADGSRDESLTDQMFEEVWAELFRLGSLKDSLDLSSNESKRRIKSFIDSLPICQDCGEKHPPIDHQSFFERGRSLKNMSCQRNQKIPPTLQKTGCQWPNPCKADCFEEHPSTGCGK